MISYHALIITYFVIGLFFAIGELKTKSPTETFAIIEIPLLVLILTIGWIPLIIVKAIWGKK
jgi:hypothetical protein